MENGLELDFRCEVQIWEVGIKTKKVKIHFLVS